MTSATRFTLFAAALAPALALSSGPAGAQPSFDCGAARTATERAICADPDLADLERNMVAVYEDLVTGIGEARARRIADIQLERRQACEGDTACIERQLLTSIGIFRAETRAAASPQVVPPAQPAPSVQPAPSAQAEAPSPAQRRSQALQDGFVAMPEYRRRNVQGRLRDAGLLAGPIDGIWGRASEAGVEAVLRQVRERGRGFEVARPEGVAALYRFIDSDIFYYDFLPEAAR